MGSPERAAAAPPPRQPSPPTVFFYKKFVMCVRRGGERARKSTRLRLPEKAFFAVVRLAFSGPGSAPRLFRCSRSARGMRPAAWAPRQAPHWLPCPGVAPLGVGSAAAPGGARGLVVAPTAFFCALFSLVLWFFCAPFSPIQLFGVSSGALGYSGHKKTHENTNQLRKTRILRSCQFLPKRNEGRRLYRGK